jgi:all-trans-retinol 13,14-reductase
MKYDVLVIGSGIGGLVCANILARQGLHVCVAEKNKQAGGNLQTFSRDKLIFDSGVHYIGGLDKGQNLYQLFKYLGIMDELKLERLNEDAFDKIIISGDEKEYAQAQGYENFIRQLVKDFPGEEEGIRKYCDKIKDVCQKFPLYNLRANGLQEEKTEVMNESAKQVIESFTQNKKLQAVLAGNNLLYAGAGNRTPFYILALTINSCIESAWRCVNGGSQIAKLLVKKLREYGGEIIRNCEISKIVTEDGKVRFAQTKDGRKIYADNFVSNTDPVKTLEMTDSNLIREAYRNRMKSIENTISSFAVHLVLKEAAVPYRNYNYYYHKEGHVWDAENYTEENWPLAYGMFFTPSAKHKGFAESITLLTVMKYEEVKPWASTFNTTSNENDRGKDYQDFKIKKAERLLDVAEEKFSWLRSAIKKYYTTSPLSYRDYIGTRDGTLYGFARDFNNPLKTMISPRTKLPNLYLTGQNLNVHGILGTSVSSILTSIVMLNNNKIVEDIKNA